MADNALVPGARGGASVSGRAAASVLPAIAPAPVRLSRAMAQWAGRLDDEARARGLADVGAVSGPYAQPRMAWSASAGERQEATALALAMRRFLDEAAGAALVEAWLMRATALITTGPVGEARLAWAGAALSLLVGRPARLFTVELANTAAAGWKYWPTGPELTAVLDAAEVPYRAALAAAEAALAAPVSMGPVREAVGDRAERTPGEIAAVQVAAAAFRAEVHASEVARSVRVPAAARVLAPLDLIASYESQAEVAASAVTRDALLFRAACLRRQFGQSAADGG